MQPKLEETQAHFTPVLTSDSKVQRENKENGSNELKGNAAQTELENITKWTRRPLERLPNKAARLFDLPHAPTYYPTEEEFEDPAAYVASIRREAEKFGICKIVPPPTFNPKFALNIKEFSFKSRKQQPSATGASTRIKLNFIENLKAFHLQTYDSFKVPTLSGQQVDLYQLYLETKQRGGYSKSLKDKIWAEIGSCLSLPQNKSGSYIKSLFEKYILPYEEYINSDKVPKIRQRKKAKISSSDSLEYDSDDCGVCHTSQSLETLIVCEVCEVAFHLHCLDPPLKKIPKVDFFCAPCLKNRESGSGFEEGDEYTLAQFGIKAEKFKQEYLELLLSRDAKVTRLPLGSMSTEEIENMVEREFWNLVGDPLNSTTVEYGADLPGNFHGSGFPSPERQPDDANSRHGWNLNNLATLKSSLFSYHKEDIYGMTVPWLYIGMCFSMFCWHTEDHYAYSFNYQHWGDAKTWYGIPAAHAESFEVAFRKEAPELFVKHPDLLSHLTNILSPKDLLRHNVPVYVIDQRAGEFVITFPRAYHAGFNHGFNFNEAVNFAPVDWLPFGLECLARYRQLRKNPVFSHHGLLLRAASTVQDGKLAQQLTGPLETMRTTELETRNRVAKFTNRSAYRPLSSERTSELPHCKFCQTICYFSVVGCTCDENRIKVACLDHAAELCDCPLSERVLYEHFPLEELDSALRQLEEVANPLTGWLQRYQNALQTHSHPKKAILEQLVEDACTQLREPPEEAGHLSAFLNAASQWREQVVRVLEAYSNKDGLEIVAPSELCRHIQDLADQANAMSMDEDVDGFIYLARFVTGFCSSVRTLQSNPNATLLQAFDLQNQAALLGLRLEEATIIDDLVDQLKWMEEAKEALQSNTPSKCMAVLTKKPTNPGCQTLAVIGQLESKATAQDGLVRVIQELLDESKLPNFRKRPVTAKVYPILSRIDAQQAKLEVTFQLIASNKEVEGWLSRIQQLFEPYFGPNRSLLAKLTTLHKQSQEFSSLDGIRGCICNSQDSTGTLVCATCKVAYHSACVGVEGSLNKFVCSVCDTSKYRPIQASRIQFNEMREIWETGTKLPFIPPELNLVNDLIEQLQVISKLVDGIIRSESTIETYKATFRLLEGLFVFFESETHAVRNLIVNQINIQASQASQACAARVAPLPPASSLLKVAGQNPSNQVQGNFVREPLTSCLLPPLPKPQLDFFHCNPSRFNPSTGTLPTNGHSERYQPPEPTTSNLNRSSNPFSIESLLGNSGSDQHPAYPRSNLPYTSIGRPPAVSSFLGQSYPSRPHSLTHSVSAELGLRRSSYHQQATDETFRMNPLNELDARYNRSNRINLLTSYPLEQHLSNNLYQPTSIQNIRQAYPSNHHQTIPPYSSSHHSQPPHDLLGFYSSNSVTPSGSHPNHSNGLNLSNLYPQHHQPQPSNPSDNPSSLGRNSQTIVASHLQPSQPPGP